MKIKSANKYLFVLFLLIASLAGASAATGSLIADTETPSGNSNIEPAATPKNSAAAQNSATPESLIADLYRRHDAQKGPFFQNKNRALVDKYFTKKTADLIWKDATRPNDDEIGALDGDPLYDTQDAEIKKFAVGKADIQGETATVPVTFVNFDKARKFIISLQRENSKWKIDDIKYDSNEGYTLVSILSDSTASEPKSENEITVEGEFEGAYKVGDTTCTVKPIKMAFEVKWAKGTGTEIFFAENKDGQYKFVSDEKKGKANTFLFDDENYNTGTFYRADGKQFPIKKIE